MAETVEISGYMSNVGMGTTKTIENCAGSVKTLSKQETYNYFNEETWNPFNVPQKYWR